MKYRPFKNKAVEKVFERYPRGIRKKLLELRELIFDVAAKTEGIDEIEETLKWSEPSYIAKHGSTIRIDWKERAPEQYAMYFKCTSKLVPTFKKIYGKTFVFEKDRAIVFSMGDIRDKAQLRKCVVATLQYHKVKHLPFLGMKK